MSRKSPSGPVAITDQIMSLGLINNASTLVPGDYFVGPLFSAILSGSSFVLITDPNTPALLLLNGSEAAKGRIGSARLYSIFPVGISGDPLKLQMTVNAVPVGNQIEIPLVGSISPATIAEALAVVKGAPIDLGDVKWEAGDVVVPQITVGAISAPANQLIIGLVFDKNYD